MALLMVFAFVAGAGTAVSPCVLPVLPAALSAGATGGRRRPLGVATGITLSFTFAVVAAVYVIDALGLPDDFLRVLAIVVMSAFGAALLAPRISAAMEGWLSRRFSRAPSAERSGFGGGVVLGLGLGLVYFPCAGPVLAGVITVSASQELTAQRLAVAIAYALGSAIVLYALMLGGRRLTSRLSARSLRFQQALGAVMVAVAVAMAFDLDIRFQTAVADELPAFLVNPTSELEETEAVSRRLGDLRDDEKPTAATGQEAPEFTDPGRWFNTERGEGLTMRGLRGRVVLVDFWTYTCINCIRTFPYLKAWDSRYRDSGLTIVGVHTPEFPFEREAGNVREAIADNGIRYPVVQDNDYGTWNAFGNRFWPAKYLIDAEGRIRYTHFGEGEYDETEDMIRALLAEAGERRLGDRARAEAETADPNVQTPETYLGTQRAAGFAHELVPGRSTYPPPRGDLPPNGLAFQGAWELRPESALAGRGARLHGRFLARRVFLVLSSTGRPRRMRVLLDGRPVPPRLAGEDVRDGAVTVRGERLYRLVDLPAAGDHTITLVPEAGVAGFAFTFG